MAALSMNGEAVECEKSLEGGEDVREGKAGIAMAGRGGEREGGPSKDYGEEVRG
tara:strand:- start:558 stop:719 length:162 start_codon:yes stop_codon:yes gene_type:complete